VGFLYVEAESEHPLRRIRLLEFALDCATTPIQPVKGWNMTA
jgi:hypothetical protein